MFVYINGIKDCRIVFVLLGMDKSGGCNNYIVCWSYEGLLFVCGFVIMVGGWVIVGLVYM